MIIEVDENSAWPIELPDFSGRRLEIVAKPSARFSDSRQNAPLIVPSEKLKSLKELRIRKVPTWLDSSLFSEMDCLEQLVLSNCYFDRSVSLPESVFSLGLYSCRIPQLDFCSNRLNYFTSHSSVIGNPICLPDEMHRVRLETTDSDLPEFSSFPIKFLIFEVAGWNVSDKVQCPAIWRFGDLELRQVTLQNVDIAKDLKFNPLETPPGEWLGSGETFDSAPVNLQIDACSWHSGAKLRGTYGRLRIANFRDGSETNISLNEHLADDLSVTDELQIEGWNLQTSRVSELCSACSTASISLLEGDVFPNLGTSELTTLEIRRLPTIVSVPLIHLPKSLKTLTLGLDEFDLAGSSLTGASCLKKSSTGRWYAASGKQEKE